MNSPCIHSKIRIFQLSAIFYFTLKSRIHSQKFGNNLFYLSALLFFPESRPGTNNNFWSGSTAPFFLHFIISFDLEAWRSLTCSQLAFYLWKLFINTVSKQSLHAIINLQGSSKILQLINFNLLLPLELIKKNFKKTIYTYLSLYRTYNLSEEPSMSQHIKLYYHMWWWDRVFKIFIYCSFF